MNLFRGGGLNFFLSRGAQHPLGHENPLKSIDFTGPGRLSPESPPLNTPLNILSGFSCIIERCKFNIKLFVDLLVRRKEALQCIRLRNETLYHPTRTLQITSSQSNSGLLNIILSYLFLKIPFS